MDNKVIDFDCLLTAALYRAAELDYGNIPPDDELEQILHISPQYKSKMDLLFTKKRKKANQKQIRPFYIKFMQTAAVVLVTLTLLLGTLMLVSPTVRAEIINFVRTWFEDRTAYSSPDVDIEKEWTIGYVPDGFKLVDTVEHDGLLMYVYQNDSDPLLFIQISSGKIVVDNEHSDFSQATLSNGKLIDIYESNDPIYPSKVVFYDEATGLTIIVTSELAVDELIKIMENIS